MAGPLTRPRLMQEAAASLRAQRPGATRSGVPVRPRSRARSQLKTGLSTIDRAVVMLGILAAVASASFATYMVAVPDRRPVFGGVEHLMIFAQPKRGSEQPLIARAAPQTNDQGIDFGTTGTIPEDAKVAAQPSYTLPAVHPAEEIVSDFTLRGVSGDVAMVENADGIYRVEIGSVLPRGGRVLAIEWRQGRFVVVTTRGIIREVQP
ncbi:MAG TPA: hypothetical protein VIJ06_07220 [Methylovirgula sp.]